MASKTRSYTVGAATAVVVGAMLAVATPAQAASYSVTVTCDNASEASQTLTPGVVAGDTLTVVYNTSGANQCNFIGIVPAAGQTIAGTLALTPISGAGTRISGNYIYPLTGTGTVVLTVDETPAVGGYIVNPGYSASTPPVWGTTTSYLINQGALPEPGVSAPTPADILQQTPVPPSGSCTDVADEGFRYGTSVSGGWSTSWASWIGSEIGGEVCTRTLTYSNSRGAWVVAS